MLEIVLENLVNEEIDINNQTALIVVDMINDGCRKDGVFEKIGFDISSFNKIERNVIELVTFFSKREMEVIYVRTFYDFEYLSNSMIDKFIAFGLDRLDFSKKGHWGSELIDSLPDLATAFVLKSHYSAFSEGYSALFDKKSFIENKIYFSSKAKLDADFKDENKATLKDYYKQSLESEMNLLQNSNIIFPITLHGYLKSKSVDTLVCVGGSTHVCLAATVYSASERGYNVILPIDAIASEDIVKHKIYLQNFHMFNSILTKTLTLIK